VKQKEKKILVVEDDLVAARMVNYALEQRGYQVLTAANGTQGLRKAQDEKPDLIILGVMLPGVDGLQVCRRLRADSQTAQIPILMISAKAQDVEKATAIKVGADDYLSKPVGPSEIASRVEALLSQKSADTAR